MASTLFLEPTSRSVLSLVARLFPSQTVEDVLQTPTGVLAAQLVETSINKAFPPPPWLHSSERKGKYVLLLDVREWLTVSIIWVQRRDFM